MSNALMIYPPTMISNIYATLRLGSHLETVLNTTFKDPKKHLDLQGVAAPGYKLIIKPLALDIQYHL